MIELTPEARDGLGALFDGFRFMPTVVRAVIEEGYGHAWVDDFPAPRVAIAHLDFNFLAGDVSAPSPVEAARMLDHVVVASARWRRVLAEAWGEDQVQQHERVSFGSFHFDRDALQRIVGTTPTGFELVHDRTEADLDAFETFQPCLIWNFPSRHEYLRRGLGFGLRHGDRFVAGASSFCVAGKDLEFEIQSHADFRRRGFATIVAARMILHCLDHGITPHWDAHNPPSASLAVKLGFTDPLRYETFHRKSE
jgi:hypothetical protein